jgi:hypothetical protein
MNNKYITTMRKIIFLFIGILLMFSCNKETDYNVMIGEWVSEQDDSSNIGRNVIYYGFFDDTLRTSREITFDDTLKIKIADAPQISVGGEFKNHKLYYGNYSIENHPTDPTCAKTKIYYHDITGQIRNDSLIEIGYYTVSLNGIEQSYFNSTNMYIAKFVKRQ